MTGAAVPAGRWQVAFALAAIPLGLLAGFEPKLAFGAAMALAALLVVSADLTLGLGLFVLLIFSERVLGGSGDLSIVKGFGLLLALSWLMLIATRDEPRREFFGVHPIAFTILLLFIAWCGLSLLWAEDTGAAGTDVMRYGLNASLLLITFTAVHRREHAITILSMVVIAAALSTIYGVVTEPPADSWTGYARIEGGSGTANELATLVVVGMILGIGLIVALRDRPLLRLALAASVLVCGAGLLLTLSRAGLVAFGCALVASVFVSGRWRPGAIALLSVVAVIGFGYFTWVAAPEARERVTSFADGGTGRTDIWTVGWRMVEDNAVVGVGVGNYRNRAVDYLLVPGTIRRSDFIVDRPLVAHNIYLNVLAELGVVGLGLFLFVLGFAVRCAWRAARVFGSVEDRAMELVARAVVLSLVAIYAADFFASDQLNKELWVMLGIAPALLAIANRQRDAVEASAPAGRAAGPGARAVRRARAGFPARPAPGGA